MVSKKGIFFKSFFPLKRPQIIKPSLSDRYFMGNHCSLHQNFISTAQQKKKSTREQIWAWENNYYIEKKETRICRLNVYPNSSWEVE